MIEDCYLTTAEAVAYTKHGAKLLYRAIQAGHLKATGGSLPSQRAGNGRPKKGSNYRFKRAALDAWMRTR